MATGLPAPRPVQTPADFVGELRRLKAWSGLSYRDLERVARAHGHTLAPSTLATALSRPSLPQPTLVTAFVVACGGGDSDVERWMAARRVVAQAAAGTPSGTALRLLPPDPPQFVGRTAEFARALQLIGAAPVLVTGPAGVGKTTFAIRLGHAAADRFPDGQLYCDLRGFDPGGSAVSPAEVVRVFLDALEVPADRVPATLEAQVGLYRRLLADKRLLVILDNARDTAQVTPLLPGAAGCAVLVTSRDELTSLIVASAAQPVALDLLPPADARDLLAGRLGRARLRAEPQATDEIIAACARLPLALAIVAARATTHPTFALRDLAHELRASPGGLDPLADIRAVFSWSYRLLDSATARTFRRLSAQAGPDISGAAAASLVGLPPAAVGRTLTALTRAHLLSERTPGRYAMHDLLRGYAAELAAGDGEAERRAATARLLDHYLHTAHAARERVDTQPVLPPASLGPPPYEVTPEAFTGRDEALDWLATERSALLAACHLAAGEGFDDHTWQLARAIAGYLDDIGHWPEVIVIQQLALTAARRLGNGWAEAGAHHSLAIAHARQGEDDRAYAHYERALVFYSEAGELLGQAHAHRGLGGLAHRRGSDDETFARNQQALALYEKLDHRNGQAMTLNNFAWLRAAQGHLDQALLDCRRALALLRQSDDRHAEAATWDTLGFVHGRLRQTRRAVVCYRRASTLYRETGDRYNQADSLRSLAELHSETGNDAAAARAWRRALDILDDLGHPDAGPVRRRLRDLAGTKSNEPERPAP